MWGQTTAEAVLAWSYQLTVVTTEMPVVPPGVDPWLLEVLLSPSYPTGVRECRATRDSKSESPASPAILCVRLLRGLAPGLVTGFGLVLLLTGRRVICFIPIWGGRPWGIIVLTKSAFCPANFTSPTRHKPRGLPTCSSRSREKEQMQNKNIN